MSSALKDRVGGNLRDRQRVITLLSSMASHPTLTFTPDEAEAVVLSLVAKEESEYTPCFRKFAGAKGCIDQEDYLTMVALLDPELSGKDATLLYETMDEDGSGVVEFSEFVASFHVIKIQTSAKPKMRFLAKAAAHRYEPPWKPNPELEMLGKDFDMAVQDLLRGTRKGEVEITGEEVVEVLEKLFRDADVDGSLQLDKYEMAEVMREYYRLTGVGRPRIKVVEEVEAAMARYDTDRSGGLDFKEFCLMFSDQGEGKAPPVFKAKLPVDVMDQVARLARRMIGSK